MEVDLVKWVVLTMFYLVKKTSELNQIWRVN